MMKSNKPDWPQSREGFLSLRRKLLLSLVGCFLCGAAGVYFLTQTIISRDFVELEKEQVRTNMLRVVGALKEEIDTLRSTGGDWGPWDEPRDFVLGKNPSFPEDNLGDTVLANLNLNFMIFLDRDKNPVASKGVDLETGQEAPIDNTLIEYVKGHSFLTEHAGPMDSKAGLGLLPDKIVLLSSWPITSSSFDPPIHGTLVLGRFLDEAQIEKLAQRTQLSLAVARMDGASIGADFSSVLPRLREDHMEIVPLDEGRIAGYSLVTDIRNTPIIALRVDMPRDIVARGRRTGALFMVALLILGFLSAVAVALTFQVVALKPLMALTQHVTEVRRSGDLTKRAIVHSTDELGILSREFDGMLGDLEWRERFERLISEVSSTLVGVSARETDAGIRRALAAIASFIGADHARVLLLSRDAYAAIGAQEWHGAGLASQGFDLKGTELNESLPWFAERLRNREVIHVPSVAALPPEARLEREHLEARDIDSLIVVPMVFSGDLIGLLAFSELEGRHSWSDEDQALLRLIAEAFANALERNRAEEARRASEERYKGIFDHSIAAIYVFDADKNFLDSNLAGLELLGYTREELLSMSIADVDADPEKVSPTHQELLSGFSLVGFEHDLKRKDGRIITVLNNSRPLTDLRGKVIGMQSTLIDITERKRAEEERLELERQVQQSQKLESLGILAGGIAHDFNNILMAVIGYADLALRDLSETHPARASVHEIENGARRAAELTRQMLAYSGKGHFLVDVMDVSALVDDMAHLLRTSISRKVNLNLQLERSLPPIEADVAQMQQIVMNLITNAAEAIGDKVGAISLSTGVMEGIPEILARSLTADSHHADELPGGSYVFFEVSDTGCGMDEETRERIFEPFFTTKFTGRGLGMAAVLGIVRGHKGAILLDTEPGKGTTFRVLFPASARRHRRGVDPGPEAPESVGAANKGTVLVVDDEEIVRNLTANLLERMGFTVLTATDGYRGVELFREHTQDIACVLLDLTMPHMDGKECFEQLREISEDVPVIMSSGYSEEEVSQRFAGRELAGFIQKPYTMTLLSGKLRGALGKG